MASSPMKLSHRKLSGAASYANFCNKDWEQKYSIPLRRTAKKFRCNVCLCNISRSPQREADVKRHCDGPNHIKRQKAFENTRSLSSFVFTKATDSLREQVCSRGSYSRLDKCMQRSVKLLNLKEIFGVKTSSYIHFLSGYHLAIKGRNSDKVLKICNKSFIAS